MEMHALAAKNFSSKAKMMCCSGCEFVELRYLTEYISTYGKVYQGQYQCHHIKTSITQIWPVDTCP